VKKLPLLLALAAFGASPALAQSHEGHDAHAAAPAPAAKSGSGTGVIKAVDAKAGKLTLHHGPVAALGWPAMTMDFKAAPDVLKGAKVGQKVKFTAVDGETPEVTALSPQ
jgi:Cu(I)/Ag(I) efflux system protein CusF